MLQQQQGFFSVDSNAKVNKQELENAEGAKGVFEAQGQLQIIFGTGTVNKVYAPKRADGRCEGVRPMESVIAALITGAITLIGVMIANSRSQAVTDTKLEELTREVREHNNFARRVPILEEQMKVANHRIADLEADEHERERNCL